MAAVAATPAVARPASWTGGQSQSASRRCLGADWVLAGSFYLTSLKGCSGLKNAASPSQSWGPPWWMGSRRACVAALSAPFRPLSLFALPVGLANPFDLP